MRTLFSTADYAPEDSFRFWRETIFDRIVPVELTPTAAHGFAGSLEAAEVGPLLITRVTQSAVTTVATPDTIRRHGKYETLNVAITLKGRVFSAQDDRTAIQNPGDIVVMDRRPAVMGSDGDTQTLFIEMPRACLERALGSTRRFTALTIGADQVGTSMVTTFFQELARTAGQMTPDMANRMASIGVDLVVASIAERLAHEPPRNIQGILIFQRALAHIEANLGDVNLDPAQLAAAVGVSLRHLQTLFREQDRNIADWIWRRRLESAAQRLTDPGFSHLSVGELAYSCGFSTQSHFSRRFKESYGLSPSDYRRAPGIAG
ncbi:MULTISPECIES: helix-turn-helix domain-containing protein [Methylobacterium]|jgi:AraC-like DNA-binding protein|uniref:AraC-type DNA-binding protein n=1 Tax=Methylobacterium phyllosphaerae TaxID=418223 RepID=A0AAE8HQH4_9HYPH|nr:MULTISPECIES: helix-turn-helix domain-containing protein [Methylobacterium]APT33594.1 transcriptional activator NphR [Methylobacterium phyllosphaerae]RUP16136.1 MAG: helix-turn-helix domain-containing protein [Methylobacterium sp.]WFS07033.1 helix-turn-helix domain-containing protein [Methylobacterium sp. 391_Methyba4]SFG71447.1 AraC-type DNA-binding protein [Methylobacterium phyllosphaerae]SFU98969.1 AraC-type DNA-binding protein [Methylobacterium sp. UNCCL125]